MQYNYEAIFKKFHAEPDSKHAAVAVGSLELKLLYALLKRVEILEEQNKMQGDLLTELGEKLKMVYSTVCRHDTQTDDTYRTDFTQNNREKEKIIKE